MRSTIIISALVLVAVSAQTEIISKSKTRQFTCPDSSKQVPFASQISLDSALALCKECSGADCVDRGAGFVLSTNPTKPIQVFIFAKNAFFEDVTKVHSFPGQTYLGVPTSQTSFKFTAGDKWGRSKSTVQTIPNPPTVRRDANFKPTNLSSMYKCPSSGVTPSQFEASTVGVQAAYVACAGCFPVRQCRDSGDGFVTDITGKTSFGYGPAKSNPFGVAGGTYTYTQDKDFTFNLMVKKFWAA